MFYLPVDFKRFPAACRRPLLLAFLSVVAMAVATPVARATVLFSENFGSAVEGQTWGSYPRWSTTGTGTGPAVIITAHGQKMGTFANDGVTLTTAFTQTYSLATQGYRLSLDISGSLNRALVVVLGDSNNDRLGMELGYTGNNYGIGGTYLTASQSYGQRTHYNPDTGAYGGYYSATTAPLNFSTTALYHATIDINGTSSALEIGGSLLEAGKMRIIFNDGQVGGMATYTVLFDIPVAFDGLSTLQIGKTAGGGAVWSIGNLALTSYAVVPEPSTLAALLIGGLFLCYGLGKRRV